MFLQLSVYDQILVIHRETKYKHMHLNIDDQNYN